MSRGGLLLLLLAAAVIGFFYFGGSANAPENAPTPEAPSVDEAAGGLRRFFNNIADAVTGWNEGTWRIIAVGIFVAIGIWVFRKVPTVVWLVIAVLAALIAVQL